MWLKMAAIISFCIFLGLFQLGHAVELTFELPDSAKECFYEMIDEGVESTVEFQVDKTKTSSKVCVEYVAKFNLINKF